MIKRLLTVGSVLALVLMGGVAVQAQSQAPANSPSAQPSPKPQAPANSPNQAAPQAQVSPEELQKFSNVVKQLLVIGRDAETRIGQAIQKQGLTEERFGEIYQAQNNPNAKPARQITSKEQQSYNQAIASVRQIQQEADTKLQNVVKSEGLEIQRFNQIFAEVQKNPQLRQEVQRRIQPAGQSSPNQAPAQSSPSQTPKP